MLSKNRANQLKTKDQAPKTLSAEAKNWWKRIVECYEVDDDGGRLLLQTALEAFDSMRQSQAVLDREGQTYLDRFQKPRQHPEVLNLRDSRTALLKALRQLNLDVAVGSPLGKGGH